MVLLPTLVLISRATLITGLRPSNQTNALPLGAFRYRHFSQFVGVIISFHQSTSTDDLTVVTPLKHAHQAAKIFDGWFND